MRNATRETGLQRTWWPIVPKCDESEALALGCREGWRVVDIVARIGLCHSRTPDAGGWGWRTYTPPDCGGALSREHAIRAANRALENGGDE